MGRQPGSEEMPSHGWLQAFADHGCMHARTSTQHSSQSRLWNISSPFETGISIKRQAQASALQPLLWGQGLDPAQTAHRLAQLKGRVVRVSRLMAQLAVQEALVQLERQEALRTRKDVGIPRTRRCRKCRVR